MMESIVTAALAGCLDRRSIVHIINSKGIHVGVIGSAIFDLGGQKLYELKGINLSAIGRTGRASE